MDSPASGPRFRWHLLSTRLGFSTRNIRRVFVPIILLAALLTLSGCVRIIGHTIPTNVELKASDIYTMKLRVQPTNDVTGDYRMTLALRLPDVPGTINPFRVHSVTYAGAVSGSFVRSSVMDSDEFWASVMELYFTFDWQLKPIDAKHNGHGDGNGSWWVGYSSGSAKGVKATQWVDITIEVVNHQGVADGLIDIVTGATSWAYPEDKGRNGDGELWEAGDVLLNQPVKFVTTVPYVLSTNP
ncbi:MAG: hypothetical protein MUQ56_01440, partial [Thermoleophilia bacterium]|nr:hypothetical protein [Thermoleophilia bacterium]